MRLRQTANLVTLATPLGVLLAAIGRARLTPGPHGVILAHDYRCPFPAPRAGAVTVGDVVLLRLDQAFLDERPQVLDHEARHAVQWACFLGPVGFLPAYLAASAWSWWRTGGNFALRNPFEVRAGLADGGYVSPPADPPVT